MHKKITRSVRCTAPGKLLTSKDNENSVSKDVVMSQNGVSMGAFQRKSWRLGAYIAAGLWSTGAAAAGKPSFDINALPPAVGVLAVLTVMALIIGAIMTTRRLGNSSLFNRLFIVVAVASAFFSAVSSAIGFSLITSQESADAFRNSVLPAAFGVFVFFLAVAVWVGGAELVRHRDWFRKLGRGVVADATFFIERAFKLLVIIPMLAVLLFFISTWTTVVGIGGVDAVRYTYQAEIERLQSECAGITGYRQKDFLFLEDLRLSVTGVARVARSERRGGAQSGAAGPGAVTAYFTGIADWLGDLKASVAAIIDRDDPSGLDPYDPDICATKIEQLSGLLSRNAFDNYDLWAREFEAAFNDFAAILNRWRQDRRIEKLLEQQLTSFSRANPKPVASLLSPPQSEAITRYAESVEKALKSLIRKQKLTKPPAPKKSAAERSPARGLDILREMILPPPPQAPPEKISRTQAVVAAEFVPGLSTISPRDAVLKNANIFSDIWALAISWDYAAYLLMFVFLFFPSAERAAGFKD